MTLAQDEARALVRQIQFAAQKCRSNTFEGVLPDDEVGHRVLADLMPRLDPQNDLNLIDVCDRMLADGREITGGDLFNLLTLVEQTPVIGMWWMIAHDGDELPSPREALAAGLPLG